MEHNSTCLTDENKLKKCVDIGNKILPTKCIIEKKNDVFYKFVNM